ncbi:hypothetical protein KAR48_05920 [bacterium]|nr:hypothetical protein [bacterium]
MFNLEKKIEAWRVDYLACGSFTTTDIAELETHLLSTIEEYKDKGLSDEDSFILAYNRIGNKDNLAEAFMTTNYRKVWLNRLVWILGGYLTFQIIYLFTTDLTRFTFLLNGKAHVAILEIIFYIALALYSIMVITTPFLIFSRSLQQWMGLRIAKPGPFLKNGLIILLTLPILSKTIEFFLFITGHISKFIWGWQGESLPHLIFIISYVGFINLLLKRRSPKIKTANV